MFDLPTVCSNRSVKEHNINFSAFCDWIEGSVLLGDNEVSTTDVIDILIENFVYDDQDFAAEIVDSAWAELQRRLTWLGTSSPIEFISKRIRKVSDWQDFPGHSFCIMLSYAKWYPKWAKAFGSDFTEQGAIFEELTKEAMQLLFPGWVVYPTGWTRTHPSNISSVVNEVATHLGEVVGDIDHWASSSANEAGLDLLCYLPFIDGRVGKPVFLMQCASGINWDGKLHTPNLNLWRNIVISASEPKKAFSLAYALSDKDFTVNCTLVNGLLLDRYRLLSAGQTTRDWVLPELKQRIINWIEPRLSSLPKID